MLTKSENVVRSYRAPRKYPRIFLLACSAVMTLCILCYTYVYEDTTDKNLFDFTRWSMRKVNENTISKLGIVHSTAATPRERKLVLLWTPYFSTNGNWLTSTHDLHCPVQECDVTSNRTLLNNSSAVMFHWRSINPDDMPIFLSQDEKTSASHPLVVLFNKEAPPNSPVGHIMKISRKIHLTVSYRRDSDIYSPYGRIIKRTNTFKMPEFKPNITSVCWLVSHCYTPSNREVYVNSLSQYIDVDVYGKCGNKTCPHEQPLDCYNWLAQRCKFYLSFENSICKDYSTEKLYYALMSDMVPIVMGGDDYTKYLPQNSFINVADFPSPESLAKFLREVGSRESSYLSYFKWKESYESSFVPYLWFCDLCAILHRRNATELKPHEDVTSWWFEDSGCSSVT